MPKEKKQKKGGGLTSPLRLSDALVKFIGTGENELSRTDVVKRMWDYIKQNGLQVRHILFIIGSVINRFAGWINVRVFFPNIQA